MERRQYEIRTFGCQMNVHDSERIAGVLEADGYIPFSGEGIPDLIVFNTCAVRENAANRLYGTLGLLRPLKEENPHLQFAVGGCLAQKDKDAVVDRAPWVDAVFGTHNLRSLPVLLRRARHNKEAQVEIYESLKEFPSTLPAKRESSYAAWVSISVGCNNTCTYCIVPSLRGKEIDRPPADIVAEVQSLVDEGIQEITLLGQNVNSYGMSFADSQRPRNRQAFSELLRACGEIPGLERLKFTSPHPAQFTEDVVLAMAETPAVCPQLHMPCNQDQTESYGQCGDPIGSSVSSTLSTMYVTICRMLLLLLTLLWVSQEKLKKISKRLSMLSKKYVLVARIHSSILLGLVLQLRRWRIRFRLMLCKNATIGLLRCRNALLLKKIRS